MQGSLATYNFCNFERDNLSFVRDSLDLHVGRGGNLLVTFPYSIHLFVLLGQAL